MPDTPKFDNVKILHSDEPAKELLDALEEIEPELIEFLTREERMEMTPGDIDQWPDWAVATGLKPIAVESA